MDPNKLSVSQLSEIEKIVCLEFKKELRIHRDNKADEIDSKNKILSQIISFISKNP